jgi:hypothetical protein
MNKDKIKKISFFLFGLVLIGLFSASLISRNLKDPKISGPVITFNEEKHDFGDVIQGPQIECNFEFTNTGQSDLIIKNVTTSCGCTGAILDQKKDYAPGEKGKIRVTFNTQGRTGVVEKTITVESNDVTSPHKVLTISSNVVPELKQ